MKGDKIMAKIAICGYGSRGQGTKKDGDGYAYVVNDNVRAKQRLQVIATSRKGRKFGTTAVPLQVFKENSVNGIDAKVNAEKEGATKLTKAYTGGELGASGEITKKQYAVGGGKPQSEYTMRARALAEEQYLKENPKADFTQGAKATMSAFSQPPQKQKGGTFAEYAKPFMKKGDME